MLKNQKAPDRSEALILLSRDDWTRTSDPLHPMQVRYRAAPHPDFLLVNQSNPGVGFAWKRITLGVTFVRDGKNTVLFL